MTKPARTKDDFALSGWLRSALIFSVALGIPGIAYGQELTGLTGGNKILCVTGATGIIYTLNNSDDCNPPGGIPELPTGLTVGNAAFDDDLNTTDFNGGTVDFNSSTVSFGGGTATFNNSVFFTGLAVTFDATTTFNGTTDFNAGMTTSSIVNSGSINTATLTATSGLTASAGASINMGGNQVHGVAAGTTNTDAVNVAQLNAATSGITADVTALETLTATHTTQIADIQTVNTTQASQITAIQAVNTSQNSQISALQAAQDSLAGSVDTLFDLRRSDRRDMKQGIAAAIAIAPAPMPSAPGRISYAVNGATFRGEYAVGGSLQYRLNTSNPMAVNVGFSYAGNKNNGLRVGVAGEF